MGDTGGHPAAAATPSLFSSLRRAAARADRWKSMRPTRMAAAGQPCSPSRSGGRGHFGRRRATARGVTGGEGRIRYRRVWIWCRRDRIRRRWLLLGAGAMARRGIDARR
jgi:hypothetical protein